MKRHGVFVSSPLFCWRALWDVVPKQQKTLWPSVTLGDSRWYFFFGGVGWYYMYETSWIRTWGLEMLTVPSCEISRAWHRIHWRTCGLINACWLWVTPIVPMNLGLTKTCGRPDGWYTGWQLFATHGSPQLGNFRKDSDNGSGSLPEARWVLWFFPPGRKTFTTSLDSKMFVFLLNRFCFPLLMANILYQLICHYAILTRTFMLDT